MIGQTLSHYKILAELGRGGMGVVYRAEDTKLKREVALKVLPSAALATEDDRSRFYREAQAAAQLHHPHIATIYAIDEAVPSGAAPGTPASPFIAMELIDGETLEARIEKGPLKLPDAVRIAAESAEALKAAHAKNIVHRDIKAGNIMLGAEGSAKVLDFGLAKTSQSTKLTRMGSTLGTVAYMSPEQARGEEVDHRTDVWSLGVVLYEMVCGRRPFPGEYDKAVIYGILNEHPEPLTALRTGVPMGLEWIVTKCLAKKREERYQTAADLIVDLKTVDLTTSGMSRSNVSAASGAASASGHLDATDQRSGGPSAAVSKVRRSSKVGLVAAFLIGVALTALVAFVLSGGAEETAGEESWQFPLEIHLPGQTMSNAFGAPLFDISPDGSSIVVRAYADNASRLYLRYLDGRPDRWINNVDGATQPAFSPNGRQLAFVLANVINHIPLTGGVPQPFSGAAFPGGTGAGFGWSSEEAVLVIPEWGRGIRKLDLAGSSNEEIVSVRTGEGEGGFSRPVMLPGGDRILTVLWGQGYMVTVIDLASGARTRLIDGGIMPRYVAPGYLTYAQRDQLMVAAFNPETLDIGDPVPAVDRDLITYYDSQVAQYVVSASGTLAYLTGSSEWNQDLVFRGFDGSERVVVPGIGSVNDVRVSPDGAWIAVGRFTPRRDSDVWLIDLRTGEQRQLTTGIGYEGWPVWTRDGRSIIYSEQTIGNYHVVRNDAFGTAPAETLRVDPGYGLATSTFSNGDVLINLYGTGAERLDIARLVAAGSTGYEKIASTNESEWGGQVSPDDSMIAYKVESTDAVNVYVRGADAASERVKLSSKIGLAPEWSRDGRYLYYLDGEDLLRREHLGGMQFGPEEIAFKNVGSFYALTPDGLGILTIPPPTEMQLNVAINWASTLKDKVPPLK